jgi:hypothetical protein
MDTPGIPELYVLPSFGHPVGLRFSATGQTGDGHGAPLPTAEGGLDFDIELFIY